MCVFNPAKFLKYQAPRRPSLQIKGMCIKTVLRDELQALGIQIFHFG